MKPEVDHVMGKCEVCTSAAVRNLQEAMDDWLEAAAFAFDTTDEPEQIVNALRSIEFDMRYIIDAAHPEDRVREVRPAWDVEGIRRSTERGGPRMIDPDDLDKLRESVRLLGDDGRLQWTNGAMARVLAHVDAQEPPEGTKLVLVSDDDRVLVRSISLMAAMASEGRRVTWEWGEPDEHGWYTPTFTALAVSVAETPAEPRDPTGEPGYYCDQCPHAMHLHDDAGSCGGGCH